LGLGRLELNDTVTYAYELDAVGPQTMSTDVNPYADQAVGFDIVSAQLTPSCNSTFQGSSVSISSTLLALGSSVITFFDGAALMGITFFLWL